MDNQNDKKETEGGTGYCLFILAFAILQVIATVCLAALIAWLFL